VSSDRGLIWSLAWRFVRGRRTGLLTGTSWAALAATALGVAAMVIAMALMTGYRQDLQAKLVQGSAAVVAYPLGELGESALDERQRALAGLPGVRGVQRVVYGQGSLATAARPDGVEVLLRGIDEGASLEGICKLELLPAQPSTAGVVRLVVGRDLYRELDAEPSEVLRLMTLSVASGRPRFSYRSAVISATCATGFSEFDRQWVLLDRGPLEGILGVGSSSAVLEVSIERLADATAIAARVKEALGPEFLISDYYDLNRELFTALRLQQLMLFLVLGLIVFVSTFNTASSLVVMVRERRRDFGVLAALGLAPAQHRAVFLRYGLLLGGAGTALGVALGSLVAWTMNEFEVIRFDPEVAAIYFLAAVPFRIAASDLLTISLFTLAVTLAACWLPARRAGRMQPADALRFE
jgi:lipoprotein-releasing system permease protein